MNKNNNNIFLNDNSNQISIYSIIQNLIKKVDQLTEENKEIKNRLNVLEKNNNELINIIKENRINLLKEKNYLDIPSTNISNNHKNIDNDNFQNNQINNNNSDINSLSLFFPQENFKLNELENEYNSNFLTKIQTKYLKEKTKNKLNEKEFKLNKMDIENIQDKNKLNYRFGQNNNNNNNIIYLKQKKNDDENYILTNKIETENENEIINDFNLFKNNWSKKKIDNYDKYFGQNYQNYEGKKNIMCVDENEEEKIEKIKNNDINNDEEENWSVNKSNNIVGVICLPNSKNSSFSSNQSYKKQKKTIENNPSSFSSNNLYLKKYDSNRNGFIY